MIFKTKSIIRRYLLLSLGTGVVMGLIFPPFASFFTTYKKTEYFIPFSLLCVTAGILVGVISFFIGKITLISAIKILNKHFYIVSKGDLTTRMNIDSNDEIGKIATSFNEFISSLEMMIKDVEISSVEVAKFSEYLAEAANTTRKSSEQIASATTIIAEGATNQNTNVISIQTSMQNSSLKTGEGFNKVDKMLTSTKDSSEIAALGRDYMHQVIEQFSWVSKTVAFATESIQNLGKRSSDISKVVNIISAVAAQTNLLALNASIEAARAGESGRGFAVVAEEIGKLALSSTSASKKIEELITDIEIETHITVKTMESNLEKVNTQISSITKGEEALNKIVSSTKDNENDVNELYNIYTIIQNMSASINAEISKISETISDNAACCEEVAASAYNQNNSMNNIVKDAEKLNQLSKKLQDGVNKFIVN